MASMYEVAIKSVQKQFEEVAKEGEELMKAFAPQPPVARPTSHKKLGKGSWVSGKLKNAIHIEDVSETEKIITPGNVTDEKGRPYAVYAEEGTRYMAGWHYARKTAERLRSKYGG